MPNIVFVDSFDHYAIADRLLKWQATSSGNIFIATGRNGNALQISSDTQYLRHNVNNLATFVVEFAYKAGSTSVARSIFIATDSGTSQVELSISATGFVEVRRGSGTILATGTIPVSQTTWTHYAFKCTIHNTAGAFEVRINGAVDAALNLTGQNTRATSNNYVNQIGPGVNGNGNGHFLTYDDYICSTDTFCGDCRVAAVYPQGPGNYSQWPVAPTAYGHSGGQGNRTSITASVGGTNVLLNASQLQAMMDGSYTNMTNNIPVVNSSHFMRFDFGSPRLITEATWYQAGTPAPPSLGTWIWQGSNDASTWTDIGSSFMLGTSPVQVLTQLATNVTAYRYYQLRGVSGTVTLNGQPQEIEFKIDNAVNTLLPWQCVDEASQNGDIDYVQSNTPGHRNSYDFAAIGITGNVKGVQHVSTLRKDDAGSRWAKQFVRYGGTDYDSAAFIVYDSYLMQRRILLTNPSSGTGWNTGDLDSCEFGTKVES